MLLLNCGGIPDSVMTQTVDDDLNGSLISLSSLDSLSNSSVTEATDDDSDDSCNETDYSDLPQAVGIDFENSRYDKDDSILKNVLDIAIENELQMCIAVLLAEESRKKLFFGSKKGASYENHCQ